MVHRSDRLHADMLGRTKFLEETPCIGNAGLWEQLVIHVQLPMILSSQKGCRERKKFNGRSMETFELSEALPGCNFTARIALDTDMTATKLQSLGGALNSEQAVRIPGCNCVHGIGCSNKMAAGNRMTQAWWSTSPSKQWILGCTLHPRGAETTIWLQGT